MDDKTLVIPIAFILLAAVLCWMLIGAKGKWWLKLATIIIVPGFGLAVWSSIGSYKGWPTADEPPQQAVLIWGVAREPDSRTDDPGVIYLWLIPLPGESRDDVNPLDYASVKGEPRCYKLPYTRQLHKALNAAAVAAKSGRPMMFQRMGKRSGDRDADGTEGEPQDDAQPGDDEAQPGREHGRGRRGERDTEQYQFYDLPPPTMEPKAPEQ